MLAFSFFTYDCPGGQCGQVGGYSSSLTLLNTSTMQIETLPTPPVGAVSWSPDGRKIAGTFGGGTVGTVNPDGSGFEMLAQSQQGVSVTEVAWSPDGGRLALAAWSRVCPWYCNTAISIINADGTRLRLIARAEAARDRYLWSPAWSADGNYLAYTLSRGDCAWDDRIRCGSDIVVAEAESGQFKFMVRSAGSPSWRP
jgi:Tol biopolymer transport system component